MEPVYAHGDIEVNLEDPDSDLHGKHPSGRIVVHWSSSAHHISTCEKGPTNQPTRRRWGNNARRPYRRYALRLYHLQQDEPIFDFDFDRLSHFAVFPSNEISKKLEKELEEEGRKQGKRKERKGRRGTN